MTSDEDEVTVRVPPPDEAAILATPRGVPVLPVSLSQHRKPFEVTRFIHRADRSGRGYQLPVDA